MAPILEYAKQYAVGLLPFCNGPASTLSQDKKLPTTQPPVHIAGSQGTIPSLSAISLANGRVEVYGINFYTRNLTHRYWNGTQWNPDSLEELGGPNYNPPAAVTLGATDQIDVYDIDYRGSVWQKRWTRRGWEPSQLGYNQIDYNNALEPSLALSATSFGPARVDVFGTAAKKANNPKSIYHFTWNGTKNAWTSEILPDGNLDFASGPSAVAWAPNRIAVFAINSFKRLSYQFWNGITWRAAWIYFTDLQFQGTPVAIAGPVDLSGFFAHVIVFGIDSNGAVQTIAWDGRGFQSKFQNLGSSTDKTTGIKFVSVAAARLQNGWVEVLALGTDGRYYYKYRAADGWVPSATSWSVREGEFGSAPVVTSRGSGSQFDIFGATKSGELMHQSWNGTNFYPGDGSWEVLGKGLRVF